MRKSPPADTQPLYRQDSYSASSWPHTVTGTLRFQAKLVEISEQQWAPVTRCAGSPVCGHALAPVNHCPSYG